jgi:hypothetical protein
MVNGNTNLEARLKRLKLLKEIARYEKKNNNNNNNGWGALLGRKKRASLPAETNFYNQALRRFFFSPNTGFFVILGLNRNGTPIKRRVPGNFFYRYDKKLGRIVPFRRAPPRRR